MCIIFSKPAGVAFPSITTLKACWDRNPHGARFAVAAANRVYIRKGFMTWDEFTTIDFDRLADHACVFHFRFATHFTTHRFLFQRGCYDCEQVLPESVVVLWNNASSYPQSYVLTELVPHLNRFPIRLP